MEPQQLEQIDVVQPVKIDFWHTAIGIFLKRIFFSTLAQAGLVAYNGLIGTGINWGAVRYAAAAQILYMVVSTAQTYSDPKIPNTTKAVVVGTNPDEPI